MTLPITVFHNPRCSNSRKVLALLSEAGIDPQVIDYLQVPFTREQLTQLLADMGLSARELLRSKEALYASLELGQSDLSEQTLIALMVEHPVLVNRPIVVTPLGTRLCRPPESVRALLPPVSGGKPQAAHRA
ncbi:arsenate reductase (glutaredoxin) [Hydrogenophaga sp.]|uniref:arsenate reductase (glutaredoxin) n=1 Tax=Hydrogenophaga sp. TaxID=1904254 RepID=UPI003F6CDB82